jgi:hypothetical protein
MINITRPEINETRADVLPPADLTVLQNMRKELCSGSKDFRLQNQQRLLRRVLSPDSPSRNLLMVHGTGTGKTCTAVQIAEEFIIRPEFQSKRVLVLANPSIQDNFKKEIFNVEKGKLDQDTEGNIMSKQCTGRRYLEIIQRVQTEPLKLTNVESRAKVRKLSEKIFNEFYEFQGYDSFASYTNPDKSNKTPNDYNKWIHEEFDNRLIIVDEAHNLRTVDITTESTASKESAAAIERIIKTANGVTLVLLTATPMYNTFDEIIYYFNLFLWNDRLIDNKQTLSVNDYFNIDTGEFRPGKEAIFRDWCQRYVSYVKGDNPFTFPFRLNPPANLIALPNRTTDPKGNPITKQRKYLNLVASEVSPFQEYALKNLAEAKATLDHNLICSFPGYKPFSDIFSYTNEQYSYREGIPQFLAPSKVAEYSSKFKLIMDIINSTTGIVYVYSNYVTEGANMFAMCLEEHGYTNIFKNVLKNKSKEVTSGSKGKYVLFTGETTNIDIKNALLRLKDSNNKDGSDIRVIVGSRKVAEGVDFKYVRQIHVIDPWFNMSRIEQIIGRGMRTCSHADLKFEDQNCTVYLHICRYPNSKQETLDEEVYRRDVEGKGIVIGKIKKIIMESAMDCDLQSSINNLPASWRELKIPQKRVGETKVVEYFLQDLASPMFEDTLTDIVCRTKPSSKETDYERPLSSILDVRDEVFDKLLTLFKRKPIWSITDLYKHTLMKKYSKDILDYLIQNAIESGFKINDKHGRTGKLESRDGIVSVSFQEHDTLAEKSADIEPGSVVKIPEVEPVKKLKEQTEMKDIDLDARREEYDWPAYAKIGFNNDVLNWYILDNVLTPEERTHYFLNQIDWSNPPIYAKPLMVNEDMYVLGSSKIYNSDKELFVPIGKEKDEYDKWVSNLKDKFIQNKDKFLASSKMGKLNFNIDEKSKDNLSVAKRTNSVANRACTNYDIEIYNMLLKWLVNESKFPEGVGAKPSRCFYLDLVTRKAILNNKEGIYWVTPEEFEILLENDNRADLLKRIK